MSQWIRRACELLEGGKDFVSATVVARAGSTPRTAGTRMLVLRDGSIVETIGGGKVEAMAIRSALELFPTSGARLESYDLTGDLSEGMDMICGGRLEVLLEHVPATPVQTEVHRALRDARGRGAKTVLVKSLLYDGSALGQVKSCLLLENGLLAGEFPHPSDWLEALRRRAVKERSPVMAEHEGARFLVEPAFVPGTVYLFGGGHVSQATAHLARLVDFRTVVLDDRAEFANRERFPDADEVRVPKSFESALEGIELDADSYAVIVTRGHSHDKTVLARILGTPAGYVGMIGSKRKRDTIYRKLLEEGFTQKDLERVHCPIGVSIGAETVPEIAVSIVGELIRARSEK